MTKNTFDVVLLIALPASGKSEVRKYLEHMPVEKRVADFHMGDTIQFDDFPYVHFMRCIDEELLQRNYTPLFYHSPDRPFLHTAEWGTLTELLNEDYDDLVRHKTISPSSTVEYYFDRIDAAGATVGLPKRLANLDPELRNILKDKLASEANKMFEEKQKLLTTDLTGKTIVIEFARGGPQGSSMPLTGGYGYEYSFAKLSKEILEKSVLLYIWVTPEESRRKNQDRTDPNDPGSILHHGVPHAVMVGDYGCDDIEWLENHSERPHTITVKAHDKVFYLPIAKFDNRTDKTTFLRGDPSSWDDKHVENMHKEIKGALDKLAELYSTDK